MKMVHRKEDHLKNQAELQTSGAINARPENSTQTELNTAPGGHPPWCTMHQPPLGGKENMNAD